MDIYIPVYNTIILLKYQHEKSKRPQHSPHPSALKKYGTSAQELLHPYDFNIASPDVITRVQKIDSRILYYAQSVDPTILMSLSTLVSEKSKATTQTIKNINQLIDYLGAHPDATIRY